MCGDSPLSPTQLLDVESGLEFISTCMSSGLDCTAYLRTYGQAIQGKRQYIARRVAPDTRPLPPLHEGVDLVVREGRDRMLPSQLGRIRDQRCLNRSEWSGLVGCGSLGTSGVGDGTVQKLRTYSSSSVYFPYRSFGGIFRPCQPTGGTPICRAFKCGRGGLCVD